MTCQNEYTIVDLIHIEIIKKVILLNNNNTSPPNRELCSSPYSFYSP